MDDPGLCEENESLFGDASDDESVANESTRTLEDVNNNVQVRRRECHHLSHLSALQPLAPYFFICILLIMGGVMQPKEWLKDSVGSRSGLSS